MQKLSCHFAGHIILAPLTWALNAVLLDVPECLSCSPMLGGFAHANSSAFYHFPPPPTLPFYIELTPYDVSKAPVSLKCLLYSLPLWGLETLRVFQQPVYF